jgi:hypothetical protein
MTNSSYLFEELQYLPSGDIKIGGYEENENMLCSYLGSGNHYNKLF